MEESTQVTGENVERKIKEAFGEVGTPIEGIERIGFYLDFGRDNKELEKVVNALMPEIYGLLSRFFTSVVTIPERSKGNGLRVHMLFVDPIPDVRNSK